MGDLRRGVRPADDNLVMDGFEDEVAAAPGDSAIATQLKKTEALYEKLKGALIKRDERIEELEAILEGAGRRRIMRSRNQSEHRR